MTTNIENVLVLRQYSQDNAQHMKLEDERYQENFIYYNKDYYALTMMHYQKLIGQLHHYFNKQKSNHQTTLHEDYFSTTLS